MDTVLMEKLVNIMLETGADYSEVYYEDTISKKYYYTNGKLDDIVVNTKIGAGLRILDGEKYYYSSTNNLVRENLLELAKTLGSHLLGVRNTSVVLEEVDTKLDIEIEHHKKTTKSKIEYLNSIDTMARSYSNKISQVEVYLIENDAFKRVANSTGVLTNNKEIRTRLALCVYAKEGDRLTSYYNRIDYQKGYEMLDDVSLSSFVFETCQMAIEELDAKYFEGGCYPVVIGNGFGAVIIHEACGHGLEATSVATNRSVFSNKLGQKVANDKVTLVDDGTIQKEWGSSIIDDEGEYAHKNILIEKGVLKGYLVDRFHEGKMRQTANGCGRRESYLYAPTSRMSNTYIAKGTDKKEDIIKSISYGVYVKQISHGTVVSETGDFNFFTGGAYIIRDGKICERIKDISLTGNCLEILSNIEMVSDDLKLEGGLCGSISGMIFVTAGEPTIKVSKILIGGKK